MQKQSFLNQPTKQTSIHRMKKLMISLLMMLAYHQSNAQEAVYEFGKCSKDELQMQSYTNDPSAGAVVLYDMGTSYFYLGDDGYELIFERKTKIKILTKAGLKYAQFSIPYYEENNKFEEIYNLKGNTYNLENENMRTTVLNTKKTFNEKENEHWYRRKIAMPDVKEGSVIEISYTIKSPYLFNLRNWEFQTDIPVVYSQYITKMTPFYEYSFILQGASKFDDYKSYRENYSHKIGLIEYNDMVYEFTMKNIPAFKDESFISSKQDYLMKLDFQLCAIHHPSGSNVAIMTTWPKMTREMLDNEYFGKYIKSCKKKAKEIIDTLNIRTKPALEKAKIIDRFVKSNFSWNGINDQFAQKSVKEFTVSKTGSCAEINLFLLSMLNDAGIESYPVILSTRNHGKIKYDYPFSHFFNYAIVIANIDSSLVLLDATEPLAKFSEIPSRCINEKGLIIQKNKVEWVNLKSASVSKADYNFRVKINAANDSVRATCNLTTTNYEAINYRDRYASSLNKLTTELVGKNAAKTDTLTVVNMQSVESPFSINFERKYRTEMVDGKMIVSPFCYMAITENPLKQPGRSYPVDLTYKRAHRFTSVIEIPKGYKIMKTPEKVFINNGMIKIVYDTEMISEDVIKVSGIYEFKKDVYETEEYANLKGFFNKIVDKFNDKLILTKK